MAAKRLAMAALCAAMAITTHADPQFTAAPSEASTVKLQAIVEVGTTSACGMREAPHLIEHLLLSETKYGETPVDAIIALRAQGIKLSALTRSDFTEFTLEGPATHADSMERALVTFLGRASLPEMGFEREKQAILHEVQASASYTSSPSFYERFIAVSAGGVKPCVADKKPFLSYTPDDVQAVYHHFYKASKIRFVAIAKPGTFDLAGVSSKVLSSHNRISDNFLPSGREKAESIRVLGSDTQVDLIFPIAGRMNLPEDAANAYADQARLELQAYIRREFQMYTARSFVDQSIHGGWIRLEVPGVGTDKAAELLAIAIAAMEKVNADDFRSDPIWQAYGFRRVSPLIGIPVVAEAELKRESWMAKLKNSAIQIGSGVDLFFRACAEKDWKWG